MKKHPRKVIATAITAAIAGSALAAGIALAAPGTDREPEATGVQETVALDFANYEFVGTEQLVADTDYLKATYKVNPHDSHMGILNCGVCHGHGDEGQDELFCTSCHVGFPTADDWDAYEVSVWG